MADDTPTTCESCGRTNHGTGHICEPCRGRAADQLAELAQHAPLLPLALVPGSGLRAGGVRAPKSDGAPLPLRLDAFSLLAAGTFDPDIRQADDQIGIVPLRVWLEDWYNDWSRRYQFGPVGPARVNIPAPRHGAAPHGSAALMRHLLTESKITIGMYYGAGDGHRLISRIVDTADAEYAARFGRPRETALVDLIAALASRLDAACDESEDVADFLTGLRIMLGACRAVLGERSNLTYLGHCPERRVDHVTGAVDLCGGAIWQEPYVSLIACPRCKHVWPEREWLTLGGRIRAQQQAELVAHEFATAIVVVYDTHPVDGPVEVDRYWATSCGCGRWSDQVRRKKIDARGRWQRHVDEAGKPLEQKAKAIATVIVDASRLRGTEIGSDLPDLVRSAYDQFRFLGVDEQLLLVQAVTAVIGQRS